LFVRIDYFLHRMKIPIVCAVKFKVEKILKGSLELIPSPSPSVKIQIMGGKVCLGCKGKLLLGIVNKLDDKKFVDFTQQCFALLPQVILGAGDEIESRLSS